MGSLFDGIGGFPYAASFYGIRALWASEIEAACVSVTKRHFPDMEHLGDITKVHGGRIAPVDIITFGSPCQGLSLAGLRKGLADDRSGLFLEAVRIIDEMKEATDGEYPKFALWENVPGALSSAGGRDYQTVLKAFTKAGIPMPFSGRWANAGMVRGGGADLAWCVYNSQYFGTAQRRRRVFLVADFRGERAGEILFVPKSLRQYLNKGERQGKAAAACAGGGTGEAGGVISGHEKENAVFCLAGNVIFRQFPNGGNGTGCQRGVSYTLTTKDRHAVAVPSVTMRMRSGKEGGGGRGPLLQFEKSGTLATRNDQYLFSGGAADMPDSRYHIRYMTPLEWERLQGFPDRWTETGDKGQKICDTKRYQMLGNSIAVPCATYIMQGICTAMGQEERQLHSGTDHKKAA